MNSRLIVFAGVCLFVFAIYRSSNRTKFNVKPMGLVAVIENSQGRVDLSPGLPLTEFESSSENPAESPSRLGNDSANAATSIAATTHPKIAVPKYIEVFPGLDTYRWYLLGKTAEQKEHIQIIARQTEHLTLLEWRTTRLLDLKKGLSLWMQAGENLDLIRKIYVRTKRMDVYFSGGKIVRTLKMTGLPMDIPVCRIVFNRDTHWEFVSKLNGYLIDRPTEISSESGVRGVRVPSLEHLPNYESWWIKSFECFVHESNPAQENFKKLSLLHFVATTGIDVKYFGNEDPYDGPTGEK